MILLYGLDDHPLRSTVEMVSTMSGHEIRKIDAAETRQPLKELLQGENQDIQTGTSVPKGFPAPAIPFRAPTDPLILFAGMDQEAVHAFVDRLKMLSGGTSSGILKAVITPTNIEWSITYLLEHLKEERAYFQQRRSNS